MEYLMAGTLRVRREEYLMAWTLRVQLREQKRMMDSFPHLGAD
jgi:hypothetical protein